MHVICTLVLMRRAGSCWEGAGGGGGRAEDGVVQGSTSIYL